MKHCNFFLKLFAAAVCVLSAFVAVSGSVFAADKPVVTVMVCLEGDEAVHYDAYHLMPPLMEKLAEQNGWELHVLKSEKYADFPSVEILEKTDVLVAYVRRIALPKAEMERLKKYVKEAGKGLLCIRTTCHGFHVNGQYPESCQDWKGFDQEVLGGNYRGHGSNEIGSEVWNEQEQENSAILKDVKPSVWHCGASVYFNNPPSRDLTIYQYAASSEKGRMPLTWTRNYGKPRVAYTALGHKTDFALPQFQALIRNLVNWCGEKSE